MEPRILPERMSGRLHGMELTYQLVPDDYAALTQQTLGVDNAYGKRLRTTRFLFPGILIVFTVPSLISNGGQSIADWIWIAIAVAWMTLLPKWHANSTAKQMRISAATSMGKGMIGTQELEVDERGITQRSPFGSMQRHWSGVERFVETSEYFFIYYGVNGAFIVPKSWLGDSAQPLRHTIATYMSAAAPAT